MQNAVGYCNFLFERGVILRLKRNVAQTGGCQRQAASKLVAGGFIARCRHEKAKTGTRIAGLFLIGTPADGDTVRDKLN
jgi:hypothetical protein